MAALQLIAGFSVLAVSILWRGYVLSVLWSWFVAGQFGAPAISVAQAIGLALVFGVFAYRYRPSKDVSFAFLAFDALFTPLLALGVASIVRGFL
ncbi:hypothetical protein [Methylobacterium brachiatum]|uniref:hypothetical protein n=1 Tax=Methylobacterium brachiatum TaxID=269660 RepID=UPI00244D54FA|nr:hypothetical protein [Methylobacterium brachiatum]MDH2313095.1 hypothetical protein [Methylobacterium brachiatum]